MKAFLTGSQVYGTPRHDSDIDLVVLMDEDQAEQLIDLSEDQGIDPTYSGITGCAVFRFDRLNIMALTRPWIFEAWKEATDLLKLMKPVTRATAVSTIKEAIERRRAEKNKAWELASTASA